MAYKDIKDICRMVTAAASSGRTARGPSSLCTPEMWSEAGKMLLECKSAAVVTGFYIPSASSPETDGPIGSAVLARALERIGCRIEVWSDDLCIDCVRACVDALGCHELKVSDISAGIGGRSMPDVLIYIERLGAARDGRYYDMRKNDVSEWVRPIDSLALNSGVKVIGIGDGGNEVGMGAFISELEAIMPGYAQCLSSIPADICLPVDVSNWGGYALAAVLSALKGEWIAQSDSEERVMMEAALDAGAVDGVSKRREMSVDGLSLDVQLEVRAELERAFMGSRL